VASIDQSRLTAEDCYALQPVVARMVAHYEARLLVAMYDTALCAHEPAGSMTRAADVKDHCADQLAWELHLSSSYAFSQVLLGRALVRRLPMVLTDFQAGHLDQARAAVFVDCLSGLDDETAHRIADRYLVKARTLTPAQLRERLRYAVAKADPDRARRAYLRAVPERAVWLQPFTDGTAFLGACQPAPHLAAAAFNYLDRLARAAKRWATRAPCPNCAPTCTWRCCPGKRSSTSHRSTRSASWPTSRPPPTARRGRPGRPGRPHPRTHTAPAPPPLPPPPHRRRHRRRRSPAPPQPARRAGPRRSQGPIPPPGRTQLPSPAPPGNQVVPLPGQEPLRSQVPPRRNPPLRRNHPRRRGRSRHRPSRAGHRRTGPRNAGPTPNPPTYPPKTPTPTANLPTETQRPKPRTGPDSEPGTGPDSETRNRTRFRIQTGNRDDRPQWTIRRQEESRPDREADARLRRRRGRRRRRCPASGRRR
jgi:hypothetical protein